MPALAQRLAERLVELDAERQRVERALDVLVRTSSHADLNTRILDEMRNGPGVRASMLALACEVSVATIRSKLDALDRAGVAERDGLGWKLTDRVATSA